jgi:hypothetical protein
MAKYTVNHACGCSKTHQLVGKHEDRDRKLAWLATTLCTDCHRAATHRAHQATESDLGLPALTGSEKQVAWATDLRGKYVSQAIEHMRRELRGDMTPEQTSQFVAIVSRATDAKWWIENRSLGLMDTARALQTLA